MAEVDEDILYGDAPAMCYRRRGEREVSEVVVAEFLRDALLVAGLINLQ